MQNLGLTPSPPDQHIKTPVFVICPEVSALQPALFFFLSSMHSTFSSGTPPTSTTQSKISSLLSPCTTISSPPLAVFVTLLPVATVPYVRPSLNCLPYLALFPTQQNHSTIIAQASRKGSYVHFLPNSLATFFKSIPCASNPDTAVTYFLLFLSTRFMYTIASFFASASRASAAAAFASFFFESFSARFWASTESVESEAVIASVSLYQ